MSSSERHAPKAIRRTIVQFVRRGPGPIVGALAIVGFAMGFLGYGQLDPSATLLDRLYASLQLFVLAGPTGVGVGSLPPLLNLGRFVAAAGLAGTVLTFFHRLGTERVDVRRATHARGHVVVIGSSEEARRIALARVNAALTNVKVFLLGDIDDVDSSVIRGEGVRVVHDVGEETLSRIVDGASEVIVAENDDGAADATVRHIQSLLASAQTDGRVKLRVLVRQTDLARTLREEFANSLNARVSTTSLSVVEAASQQLSGEQWLPPWAPDRELHLVVVGAGEMAKETAVSVIERRLGRTHSAAVGLWPIGEATWCESVKSRIGTQQVEVAITPWSGSAVSLARAVADTCTDSHRDHQVYVIGIDSGLSVSVARQLGLLVRNARVVVVHESHGPWREGSIDPTQSLRSTSMAELVSSPDLWDIDEQLGREILLVVRTLADLPGASGRIGALAVLGAMPDADQVEWSVAVSLSIRTAISAAGLRIEPTERASEPPVLMTDVLLAMQASLSRLFSSADARPATVDFPLLLSVLQDLPEMLRRCGYVLVSSSDIASEGGLTLTGIDRLAARAHQSYCDLVLKLQPGAIVREWSDLDPDEVESNRAQVRDLPIKLLRLGYRVVPASTPGSSLPELSSDDIEDLAWFEHLRWMHSRVINGWRHGERRDNSRRLHPLIVAYENLPEYQWEFDRGPVRLLPELLKLAGLAVVPLRR